ncbi:MAG: methyltransferase [Clostridia bacterium]|nr:methyltransferase [Clostridia bacterium]
MEIWEPLTETVGLFRAQRYPIHEDALRLAEFATIRQADRVIDLGTGNGILAVYAKALHGGEYVGVDTDEGAIALARMSTARNRQTIDFRVLDVSEAPSVFGHGRFDRVLMNPPYFTDPDDGPRASARHADETALSDWLHAAFLLLNNGGTVSLCFPADQLGRLFRALDRNRFAPKRMDLLCTGNAARLVLLEAKKLGKNGMRITVSIKP